MHRDVRSTTHLSLAVATSLGALFYMGVAHGQDGAVPNHPMMSDPFFLSLGAFYPESHTTANLNSGTVGVGAFLDFEKDLGLDDRDLVAQFMFRWRMTERWRLETEYYKLDRNQDKTITRTIDWGNRSFPVSASVQSTFKFEDTRVGVGYAFFRTKDKEIGAGLGVHVTRLEASLASPSVGSEVASTSAPLPALSVYAQIALTDRWLLNTRLDRLSLSSGDTDGSISNTGIDFIYQPWRHFNIGIGYRDVAMRVSSTGGNWRGEAQILQHGPLLFVGTTF